MKFTMLGTAAYERVPSMFCNCEVCRQAMKLCGKNLRSDTQALIDDNILIDIGLDTYHNFLRCGVNFASQIEHILITHSHIDHFFLEELQMKTNSYNAKGTNLAMTLYGSAECKELYEKSVENPTLKFQAVKPYEKFSVGKYTALALPAIHSRCEAFVYIITDGTSTVFYSLDTEILADEVYGYLSASGLKFNAVFADCCFGWLPVERPKTHMSLIGNQIHRDKLVEAGVVNADTKWYLTHFSHNGLFKDGIPMSHEDMSADAEKYGMLVAYDGMKIEI